MIDLRNEIADRANGGSVMSWTRRQLIVASTAMLPSLIVHAGRAGAQQPVKDLGSDRLVLLGTRGGPAISGYIPTPSSSLIVYKGVPYVIDAGYGATLKLVEAGVPLRMLRYVFI